MSGAAMSVATSDPATDGRRLRLLLVGNSVARGGAETQLARLAIGAAVRGHDVTVCTLLDLTGWQDELTAAGVTLLHLPTSGWRDAPRTLLRAWRIARSLRPHAIIGFDYQASLLVRVVGRLARVPVVISSIRNQDLGGPARDRLVRATDRLATVTTTNSHRVADLLLARGVVRSGRTAVVPNGIDVAASTQVQRSRAAVRDELGVAEGRFLWVCVAHLRPAKALPFLVDALAGARTLGPDAQFLVVVGDGASRDELQAHADGVAPGAVRYVGLRDDVADLLAAGDGAVLASRAEGLPNALMEAMAAGLPVVSTRVGGVAELITDGVHGWLVPPDDTDALARRMSQLASSTPSARRTMGEAGRERVIAEFDLDAAVERWLALVRTHLTAARS